MRIEPRSTVLFPALLAALLFAGCVAAQEAETEQAIAAGSTVESVADSVGAPAPDFNGIWVLNRELSQDFAEMMKPPDSKRGGGRRGGGMRGGGMRGGGMQGGGGPEAKRSFGNEGDDSSKRRQHAQRMQKEYSRIEIFHEGKELNLTNGLDISQLLFTDGRETVIWTERGEMTARTTYVPGSICILTSDRKGGPGRKRTFTLTDDGSQLVLIEERGFPGQENPQSIRMVYDRSRPGNEPPASP